MEVSAFSNASDVLTDAVGTRHRPADGPVRIVSLVPSLTELVCDLGLVDRLVGRTGFCIHPRETLKPIPKVGGTKDVKLDVVRALAPTHLIVNIDENRRETVDELAEFVPNVIVTHPCRPEDNIGLYRMFGAIFRSEAQAERLVADLDAAFAEARVVAAALPVERVLYLIWRAPWMTVSRETYISSTLAAVGWQTLPEASANRYPEVDWASISGAARVFLSTEPYRFSEADLGEVERLARRPAVLIDGEMTSWYGSRAAAGLRYLARLRSEIADGGRLASL
ncbi:MAG: helical backbone metal receptor [Aromatoleum sp.]|jgi:ABC-type Fe3+-hydroxamate transport system substrate-binding protein|uniref:helical backbone metal receptor n=1 Tax=Aromatoleum sp. TaxID=2307007 RepID=UPI0028957987|nr:helical backbone metal receptor [Aromatoleum sp.]MDT3670494.1 helical backbone metal receptor [Aromatoleum sp.]